MVDLQQGKPVTQRLLYYNAMLAIAMIYTTCAFTFPAEWLLTRLLCLQMFVYWLFTQAFLLLVLNTKNEHFEAHLKDILAFFRLSKFVYGALFCLLFSFDCQQLQSNYLHFSALLLMTECLAII